MLGRRGVRWYSCSFFSLSRCLVIVALLLWFSTGWLNGLFSTLPWPILGFVFLPTTLLWYSAVQHYGGQWTLWPIVGLVVALLIDSSPVGGRRRRHGCRAPGLNNPVGLGAVGLRLSASPPA